ncbi:MAG TPA: oxidoreductase [Capillimicrobium sp.]|jgi:NAD(P)-dependent dehydrogenase (short-subunit alcohol dehydrogenase family)
MGERWTVTDVGDLSGRRAIVTGANSGIGLVTARELARAGARVTLACRDLAKGESALARVRAAAPAADTELARLDLADLASVRAFAAEQAGEPLDLLVNNAGVMALPRRTTADGFEMQLGTNHLGHFALTGLLLGALRAGSVPRVVTVSSGAHRIGRIDFDDLQSERRYRKWRAYGQSKLANLLFCLELQRRSDAAGWGLLSVAAHPGYAATNLQLAGPKMAGSRVEGAVSSLLNRTVAQSDEMGALPTLYAATVEGLPPGAYVGPDGLGELRGHPHLVSAGPAAHDADTARRLWDVSEELTGVRFDA